LRTDILRGIRAGAILLAVLFAAVAVYRMVRVSPSANPSASSVESTSAPNAEPTATAPAAAETPVITSDVPPPPPGSKIASHKPGGRIAASSGPTEKVILVDPSLAVDENMVVAPEISAPIVEKEENPAPAQPLVKPNEVTVSQPEPTSSVPKTDGHGKRVVKAVRRFFHLPKKDAQPETLKQF
jgi:hypothetical protein